jgi:hypothetical protein
MISVFKVFDKFYQIKEPFIELGVTQQVYQFKKDVDDLYKGRSINNE